MSVYSGFEPPSNGNSISAGAIVGIVIAVLFIASVIFGILWWKGCFERKDTLEYGIEITDAYLSSLSNFLSFGFRVSEYIANALFHACGTD